jgi:hypothetical protein
MKTIKELRSLKVSLTDLACAMGVGIFTVLTAVMMVQSIVAGEFLR